MTALQALEQAINWLKHAGVSNKDVTGIDVHGQGAMIREFVARIHLDPRLVHLLPTPWTWKEHDHPFLGKLRHVTSACHDEGRVVELLCVLAEKEWIQATRPRAGRLVKGNEDGELCCWCRYGDAPGPNGEPLGYCPIHESGPGL